jgi:hypothetical protein
MPATKSDPQPKPDPSPAQVWADEVLALVAEMRGGLALRLEALAGPVPDDDPGVQAEQLHRVWLALVGTTPAGGWGDRLEESARGYGHGLAEAMAARTLALAGTVHRRLAALFAAGHNDPANPVIAAATLPGQGFRLHPVPDGPEFVGAAVAALPDPIRAQAPAAAVYQDMLVLGVKGLGWYEVPDAVRLSAAIEAGRAAKQREYEEQERGRAEADRRRWESSPEGKMAALRARVAELEAQVAAGKSVEPHPQPTVTA